MLGRLLAGSARRSSHFRRLTRALCDRASESDCFALLRTERRFDLDESQLHREYKALMADRHPDRFSGQGEQAVQEAGDRASQITDAYSVLRYPHRRAVHLLGLLGTPLTEDMGGEDLGPGFLMEIMEIREELEESGTDAARLSNLRQANQQRVDELRGELAEAFGGSELERARALTARLQYLQRIEEEIHARTEPS